MLCCTYHYKQRTPLFTSTTTSHKANQKYESSNGNQNIGNNMDGVHILADYVTGEIALITGGIHLRQNIRKTICVHLKNKPVKPPMPKRSDRRKAKTACCGRFTRNQIPIPRMAAPPRKKRVLKKNNVYLERRRITTVISSDEAAIINLRT